MVFVTGDTHGDVKRFATESFPYQKEMSKNDYVIILGDFGLVWDHTSESKSEKYWLDWLEEKPFTTLFIDGNHECFDRLNKYEVHDWHGGKVHFIRPSVIHLMRGYIFDIDYTSFFCFGGGKSQDIKDGIIHPMQYSDWNMQAKLWKKQGRQFRIEGISWWPEEMPSQEEIERGTNTLLNIGWSVDYVLTHCAPSSDVALLSHGKFKPDELTKYLEGIRNRLDYKKWYFGHYHQDKAVNDKEIAVYEHIERII